MEEGEYDMRELKDSRRRVRIVKNGDPQCMAICLLKEHIQLEDLAESICESLEINQRQAHLVRVFKAGGVEIFNEDVQYIKEGDILFTSLGEEFDESSNFALFKMVKCLGEGGYGKVYEAKNRLTKERVAIKMIDCSKIKNAKDTEMIYKELIALKGLNHKSILKVFDCFTLQKEMKVALIFEYLSGGDLRDYMQQKMVLTEKEGQKLFIQLFQAIHYIHKESIIHRDLKLENIMFDDKEHEKLKVVDFGISGRQSLINLDYTEAGSIRYIAPEVLSTHAPAMPSIDIWAMGCILFWMLTGGSPFPQNTREAVQDCILKGRWGFSSHDKKKLTKSVQNLISSMLVVDFKKRINMGNIGEHPWIQESYEEIIFLKMVLISYRVLKEQEEQQALDKKLEQEKEQQLLLANRKKTSFRNFSPQININGVIQGPMTPTASNHHRKSSFLNLQIQGAPGNYMGKSPNHQNIYLPSPQNLNDNRLALPKIESNRRSSFEPNSQQSNSLRSNIQQKPNIDHSLYSQSPQSFRKEVNRISILSQPSNFDAYSQLQRTNSPSFHVQAPQIPFSSPRAQRSSLVPSQQNSLFKSSSSRKRSPGLSLGTSSGTRASTQQGAVQTLNVPLNKFGLKSSHNKTRSSFYEQRYSSSISDICNNEVINQSNF